MTEILQHLYLGSLRELDDTSALRQRNITGIINCCAMSESALCPPLNDFECLRIYIQDMGNEPIHDYFEDVGNFIDERAAKDQSVLIHCKSGVSRSATLVIAYLVLRKRLTLREAFFFCPVQTANNLSKYWIHEATLRYGGTVCAERDWRCLHNTGRK